MKKLFFFITLVLFISTKNYAAPLPGGWGLTETNCSYVLEERGKKYWDEWIFMNASGFLSGINIWHYQKYGYSKDLTRYDDDFLLAYIYNECGRNKSKPLGGVLLDYLISLPDKR